MYNALFGAFGQVYGGVSYVTGTDADASKVVNAVNAAYNRLKDTDMKGGKLVLTLQKNGEKLENYSFGSAISPDSPLAGNDTITFENQTLNTQKFWNGDDFGKYTYEEKGVTFKGTYTDWGTVTSWSGFAISGRTETSFTNLIPDQYNSVTGGGYNSQNFLVVQAPYYEDECIEFPKPVYLTGFKYTNSAYAYKSMKNGDGYVQPFENKDWFSCNVICLGENGDTVLVKTLKLASENLSVEAKFIEDWNNAVIKADGVKKVRFAFDSSQKNDYGSKVPSYMCVDNILFKDAK